MIRKEQLRLYAITDTSWLNGASLIDVVENVLKNGATFLQLREKNATHEEIVAKAKAIKPIARKYGIPFVIDDDVQAALEADADGVHIGQSDTDYMTARSILGDNKIIGMTAKTVEQAKEAERLGADYIGTGAVFGSSTKKDAVYMPRERLIEVAGSVNIPVVAIGGIDYDNCGELACTGVDGIAVVSAIFAADEPGLATKELYLKTGRVFNYHRDCDEKIGKLYVLRGNKTEEVKELHAGDIGALAKLSLSQTTDSLSVRNNPVAYLRTNFSKPYVSMRYKAKNKGDVDKISQSLQKILMEDQTLRVVNDSENRQTLLYGMGEQQLEIVQSMLLEKYKVEIELMRPKVAFRETIRGKSDVEYKYKKQSGGHGQYGHVKMKFEPSGDLEVPYVFEQCVVGGAVPKNYFPAVEKGIAEAVLKGPLAAYPVIGVKAVLYDGSYHPVDSSEMAFKVAAKQAFKKGFLDAKPVLLEPIASVKIITPEEYTGEIMGDLNKRRGRVMNMNAENGYQEIDADLPYLELYGYNTQLRSMTSGSGTFSYEFARYEQAPEDVAAREIEERAGKVVETEE